VSQLKNSSQYYHRVLQRIPPQALPAFQDEDMQRRVWGRRWGVFNDVGTLRTILLHRPGEEIRVMTPDKYDPEIEALIDDDEQWYFRSDQGPDLEKMQQEHDAFARLLGTTGWSWCTWTGVPGTPTPCSCGTAAWWWTAGSSSPAWAPWGRSTARAAGGGALHHRQTGGDGHAHPADHRGRRPHGGGQLLPPGREARRLGMSFRGNDSGADQVEDVLRTLGMELIRVPLPGFAMHLDGGILMVDHRKPW
jgi:hypothetical protein